jgi:membrane protein
VSLLSQSWTLLKGAVVGFLEDEALTRGAAIAFYTATSFAPVLLIVIAIAGLVYGQEAAQGAITAQLGDLMGRQTAELLQTAVAGSKSRSSGFLAAAVGLITLLVTASGVFGEIQAALNTIWKAESKGTTVGGLVKARAKSLGLVAALGFLLMVSLAVSAALTAFAERINAVLPFGGTILSALNVLVSLALISFLFAAVFKVLPDCDLQWRDVAIGAIVTAVLFIGGKSLIGWRQRRCIDLRGRRRPHRPAAMGLLYKPDLPVRCGAGQSLCMPSRKPTTPKAGRGASACGRVMGPAEEAASTRPTGLYTRPKVEPRDSSWLLLGVESSTGK